MGEQKLLLPINGARMIDWVLRAVCAYPTIAVCSPPVADALEPRPHLTVMRNDEPARGMSRSLALGDAAAPAEDDLLVFLGDKPLVNAALAAEIVDRARAARVDVCYPEQDGVGGHPVFFSRASRAYIAGLSGDALHALRDHPDLRRLTLPATGQAAFADVDDRGALERLAKSNEWKLR